MAKDTLKQIAVTDGAELRQRTLEFVDQGYRITSQSSELVQLERRPRLITGREIVTFVLLLALCVLPGVIYLWVRIVSKTHVERVVLRVDPDAAAAEAAVTAARVPAGGAPLPPAPTGAGEGWLPDPSGRYPDRYWDGSAWTQWVRDKPGGTRSEDPPVSDIAAAAANGEPAVADGDSASAES
jgi:hypothetical protein